MFFASRAIQGLRHADHSSATVLTALLLSEYLVHVTRWPNSVPVHHTRHLVAAATLIDAEISVNVCVLTQQLAKGGGHGSRSLCSLASHGVFRCPFKISSCSVLMYMSEALVFMYNSCNQSALFVSKILEPRVLFTFHVCTSVATHSSSLYKLGHDSIALHVLGQGVNPSCANGVAVRLRLQLQHHSGMQMINGCTHGVCLLISALTCL